MLDCHNNHDSLLLLFSEQTLNSWAWFLRKMIVWIINYIDISFWTKNSSKWYFLKLTGSKSLFFIHHQRHPIKILNLFSQAKSIINISYLSIFNIFIIESYIFLDSCWRKYKFLWNICYLTTEKYTSFNLFHWTYQHMNKTCYSLSFFTYYQ